MKFQTGLLALLLLLSPIAFAQDGVEDYSSTISVFKDSTQAQPYFAKAYGFALFPTVGKGGFGVGAAHGKGQVYRGGQITGKTTLTHLSIGFQVGAQAFSQIIFFEDKRAYDEFTNGNFEFDAQAQAQAGTAGTTAGASAGPRSSAQAPAKYTKGMATFVQVKGGLMYEAAIGGQKFKRWAMCIFLLTRITTVSLTASLANKRKYIIPVHGLKFTITANALQYINAIVPGVFILLLKNIYPAPIRLTKTGVLNILKR